MPFSTFGFFVAEKRKKMKMSLRSLATKAELSPSQLSKIERGVASSPTDNTLFKLAYALNEDPDRLFALSGKIRTESIKDVVCLLDRLDGVTPSLVDTFANEIQTTIVAHHSHLSTSEQRWIGQEMIAAYHLSRKKSKKSLYIRLFFDFFLDKKGT